MNALMCICTYQDCLKNEDLLYLFFFFRNIYVKQNNHKFEEKNSPAEERALIASLLKLNLLGTVISYLKIVQFLHSYMPLVYILRGGRGLEKDHFPLLDNGQVPWPRANKML